MQTLRIIFPTHRTELEFKGLVHRFGGKWLDDPSPGYGVITKGEAALYVYFTPDIYNSADKYLEDEIAAFRRILLGHEPKSLVSIDIGNGNGSRQLAQAISIKFATEWEGSQDWGDSV